MAHPVRIRFITSTPLDISRGSGTYVGMHVLARSLGTMGHTVTFETPRRHLPVYTFERIVFNRGLRKSDGFDLTVGFDMDGYTIADEPGHVAALKGVIADEVRFERGLTKFTMGMQAAREKIHVNAASRVLVTSEYSGKQARDFYGLTRAPLVVPELIDLPEWRRLLAIYPADSPRFTVLFVGRMYRRKRIEILLRAAAQLRERIRRLEVRLVGNGPCAPALHALSRQLKLDSVVTWLGDISRPALAEEYNRAHVFCLPSVQEGFGIVLLEAMAAGTAVVASRAAAIPEVLPHGVLVEPEQPEALAAAILDLYESEDRRKSLAEAGLKRVELFDAPRVAQRFLEAAAGATSTRETPHVR
jgi:glycosyltransferase involved in cell wall biosynthesis